MLRALTIVLALSLPGAAAAQEGEWRMPAKDYASLRYSELADVNASNVAGLKELWNFTTGVQAGHEAAPLVADGRIYVVTPYPNYVFGARATASPGSRAPPRPSRRRLKS